jgi:hypothetical protein
LGRFYGISGPAGLEGANGGETGVHHDPNIGDNADFPEAIAARVGMGKKGAPQRRTIAIHCLGCRTLLYRYRKGGTGGLVKCYLDRIAEDRTDGDMKCPSCGRQFARATTIGGRPVHKIIQGKVFTRGMRRR